MCRLYQLQEEANSGYTGTQFLQWYVKHSGEQKLSSLKPHYSTWN